MYFFSLPYVEEVILSLQEIFSGTKPNLTITDKNEIVNEMEDDMAKEYFCCYAENTFLLINMRFFYYVYNSVYSPVRTTAIRSGYMEVRRAIKRDSI